jgi:hypothetical protein
VRRREDGGAFGIEGVYGPVIFVVMSILAVQSVDESRIVYVEFVRADPNDWACRLSVTFSHQVCVASYHIDHASP